MNRMADMHPVSFNGCFGWLHQAADRPSGDVAVLICPGLVRDALDSHHALRVMAEACANAGYATLRFDYPSTGDSCDLTPSDTVSSDTVSSGAAPAEHWQAWLDSVHDAADFLRSASGARRVVLCGLRVGAMLATLAAESRADLAGLLLLAPVLRGHSYMRQLAIEAQLLDGASASEAHGLDFCELQLSAETVQRIGAVDLRRVKLPAGLAIGLFSRAPSKIIDGCIQSWTRNGAVVAHGSFAALEPMLRMNMTHEDGDADFSGVLHWLRAAAPFRPVPQHAAQTLPMDQRPVGLHPAGCIETPLRFGPDGRLFGILCQAETVAPSMVVIFGNSGRDPHHGVTRCYVEMARKLARGGIASLRMDFAGLGDSIGPIGQENVFSHMFETDRVPDMRAAIDALQALGFSRFAVAAHCAGAFHGFHTALADARIDTLVLINIPQFQWNAGDDVDIAYRVARTPLYYVKQLFRSTGWGEIMRGEVEVAAIARAQLRKVSARVRSVAARAVWRVCDAVGVAADRGPVGTLSFAQAAMTRLARRRVQTLFVFGSDDVGLVEMAREFGPDYRMLPRFGSAAIQIVPGLDHNLKHRGARAATAEVVLGFLAGSATAGHSAGDRYGASEPRSVALKLSAAG